MNKFLAALSALLLIATPAIAQQTNIQGSGGGGSSGLTVGTTTITSGTTGHVEYNNGGVLGELATTGSGSVVLATGATLSAPNVANLDGYYIGGNVALSGSYSTGNYFVGGADNTTLTGTNNFCASYGTCGALTSGSNNVAFGVSSLSAATSSGSNMALGHNAGRVISTGSGNNTCIGDSSCYDLTTTANNVMIGASAGYNGGTANQTVANCTFVGVSTNSSTDGLSNCAAIGYQAQVTANNMVKLGNNSVTLISTGTAATFQALGIAADTAHTDASVCEDTTSHTFYSGTGTGGLCLGTSSIRYKHDVAPLVPGLAAIMALRPVSYKLNADHGDPNRTLYGFLAEQGGKVLPALVGRDTTDQPNSFDYLGVVPVLVRAIQQQQAEIDALRAEVRAAHLTQARVIH